MLIATFNLEMYGIAKCPASKTGRSKTAMPVCRGSQSSYGLQTICRRLNTKRFYNIAAWSICLLLVIHRCRFYTSIESDIPMNQQDCVVLYAKLVASRKMDSELHLLPAAAPCQRRTGHSQVTFLSQVERGRPGMGSSPVNCGVGSKSIWFQSSYSSP